MAVFMKNSGDPLGVNVNFPGINSCILGNSHCKLLLQRLAWQKRPTMQLLFHGGADFNLNFHSGFRLCLLSCCTSSSFN